jgi:hypothetical protein
MTSSIPSLPCLFPVFVRVRVLSVFRVALLFEVCLRLRQGIMRIPLHGDVIAVNHVVRLWPVTCMICFSETPARAMLRVAVRRKSWKW